MSHKTEDGVAKSAERATRGSVQSDVHAPATRGQSAPARDETSARTDTTRRPSDGSEGDVSGAGESRREGRDHERSDLGREAVEIAQDNPLATLLVASAIVIGGGLLVARIVREVNRSGGTERSSSTSLASGWGPKATHTISQLRDAAFGLALMKAVDSLERTFPGFREHFDSSR